MCGITSLTTCWNYLYSILGCGTKQPISPEEALKAVDIHPPFSQIPFGKITANATLAKWFSKINETYEVQGSTRILLKLHGDNKTDITPSEALKELKEGLRSEKKAYIYHAQGHYFLIFGYESNPVLPIETYNKLEDCSEMEEWIIIGEVSRVFGPFHIKKWSDIVLDLDQQFPNFFDIRRTEKGIQKREIKTAVQKKKIGNNLHCIIEFSSE
jgi:hypothetical protein